MSKHRELEASIASLQEIQMIMASMKNLALMESHKLTRYQDNQQQVVQAMAHALNEVRYHYAIETDNPHAKTAYLLLGSERGFCGAYNEQLIDTLAQQSLTADTPLIGIGMRLSDALLRRYPQAITLAGASIADEVPHVLTQLLAQLQQIQQQHGELRIKVIYFQSDSAHAQCQPLLPPIVRQQQKSHAPLINLPPLQLTEALLRHYLFALSHAWLYSALMAENQQRLQHLQQAERHLQKQLDEFGKRRNILRQEEIIEEIEVLLLSAEAMATPQARH